MKRRTESGEWSTLSSKLSAVTCPSPQSEVTLLLSLTHSL